MSSDFGLKIGLEGEKEFRTALKDINQQMKLLGSEMKLVQSQFGKISLMCKAAQTKESGVISRSTQALWTTPGRRGDGNDASKGMDKRPS